MDIPQLLQAAKSDLDLLRAIYDSYPEDSVQADGVGEGRLREASVEPQLSLRKNLSYSLLSTRVSVLVNSESVAKSLHCLLLLRRALRNNPTLEKYFHHLLHPGPKTLVTCFTR